MRILLLVMVWLSAAFAAIVPEVRSALAQNQPAIAQRLIDAYKSQAGTTPELIEAHSWLGRDAIARKQFAEADRYSKETYRLATLQLAKQGGKLDVESHLPTALGAAIEVEGQAMAGRGERDQAVAYLRSQFNLYSNTSIAPRIQKNINLMSLEGKPLPMLNMTEFLGPKPPPPLATLRGKPILLFFWAHWCSDCKGQVAVLEDLKREYGPKGVAFLAPTQHYGYAAGGDDAPRVVETKYIDDVWHKFYAGIADLPVPLSEDNFKRFGCSTTPTLVLADRGGIVRMYHPGAMTESELRTKLDAVVGR